jgi:hypothetical protein
VEPLAALQVSALSYHQLAALVAAVEKAPWITTMTLRVEVQRVLAHLLYTQSPS